MVHHMKYMLLIVKVSSVVSSRFQFMTFLRPMVQLYENMLFEHNIYQLDKNKDF